MQYNMTYFLSVCIKSNTKYTVSNLCGHIDMIFVEHGTSKIKPMGELGVIFEKKIYDNN